MSSNNELCQTAGQPLSLHIQQKYLKYHHFSIRPAYEVLMEDSNEIMLSAAQSLLPKLINRSE
jgi:hypothetical protein